MIINMGSGGENLKKEITEQNNLIDSMLAIFGELGRRPTVRMSSKETMILNNSYLHEIGGKIYPLGSSGILDDDGKFIVEKETRKYDDLPKDFQEHCAVILNDRVHILGGADLGKYHFEYQYGEWFLRSELPYAFKDGCAVVYNNKIHILGGAGSKTGHYEWDGKKDWVNVSTLPVNLVGGGAVIYNDEIHILSGTSHYKWNGSSWTSVSTVPISVSNSGVVVVDNRIHVVGGDNSTTGHYMWDGTSWTQRANALMEFIHGQAVNVNDTLHILGTYKVGYQEYAYKYDYSTNRWSSISNLPYKFNKGVAVVRKGRINLLGGVYNETLHYVIDDAIYKHV